MLDNVAWRAMTGYDPAKVFAIANRVHPGFFEAEAVLAERQALYPHGCYVLEVGEEAAGYVLSHPWPRGEAPALNRLLGALPEAADSYYLHDLALLPLARGIGAAGMIVAALEKHARARGFAGMSLVAVNGSAGFWSRHGFVPEAGAALADKLAGYGADAQFMRKPLA